MEKNGKVRVAIPVHVRADGTYLVHHYDSANEHRDEWSTLAAQRAALERHAKIDGGGFVVMLVSLVDAPVAYAVPEVPS